MQAAVVAVCSATFAVEAAARSLATHMPPPAGKESNAARVERVLIGSITDPARAAALVDRWRPLITLRNTTLHYDEEERDLGWHPSGLLRTAVEAGIYNTGAAQNAALLLIDTLAAIRDHATLAAAGQIPDAGALVDELHDILGP